ncbi:hypothetical protein NLX83_01700 [Allokutzneria sp. A3M-2-11 16]|uniref:hypothetical protein n=1 Tax=Allokutzneria sp. A3M-2-11 16 TaxID=2962043 RepID=UPI0020B6DC2D|nr:hypothetical protein [Allokutzneria sp. A3M-2-11 16]MCP3797963.1 hypothetical protein [Allokutzneria sp. A3M-2-11 16]
MRSTLDRLYKTKLQLIAILMTSLGVILLLVKENLGVDAPGWFLDFGSALLTTGLLAVAFEYIDRKDGDERATQRLRQVLHEEAPAIRDAVLDSFAFNAKALKDVASNDTLDRIAANALGLRLGDGDLASDIYADIRNQVVQAPERWHDVDVNVTLSPWGDGPATGRGSMFLATIRWEYRVTVAHPMLRFACVSDMAEYRELLRDPAITSVWHVDPSSTITADSPAAFELTHLTVDGQPKKIRRAQRRGGQIYSVDLGDVVGSEVTVAYSYTVLVQRHGHLLYLDLPRPTKGVHVRLSYAGAGIRRVNTLDYFASAEQARVEHTSTDASAKTVDVGFDGWVFPRAGVAFVWVLEEELQRAKR